jgi:hypothetical protein
VSARRWTVALLVALALLSAAYALVSIGYWRGTAGGRTVPVPARFGEVWLVHQPWRMADAAPPPAGPAPFAVLYGPNAVSQGFRAAADNLAGVRVWLDGLPGERVLTGWATQVTLREGRRGNRYVLLFPPIPDSQGRRYRVWVRAPQATVEHPVALRVAPGEAVGGKLRLNEYPVPGNLDLATYHRGWAGAWWADALGEQALPHAFRVRIQQYKPGWAKGGTFQAVVIASGLLALVLLAISWPGRRDRWPGLGAVLGLAALGGLAWSLASGGLLFGAVNASPAVPPPASDERRAVVDMLMSKHPGSLEEARSEVRAEWVQGEGGQEGRYALLTTAERSFSFGLRIRPGSALRFGVRAAGAFVPVSVYLDEERIWQGRAGDDWQQVEIDLGDYAGRKATVRLTSEGEAWWSSPHFVSDERWLLPDPLPGDVSFSTQRVRYGDEIELLGYTLERTGISAGDPVALTLYWWALRPVETDYTVFAHLLDPAGEMRSGADSYPVLGTFPTTHWPVGRVVADRRVVPGSEGVPGEYRIEVGLYEFESMQRLPAYDASGQRLPGDRAILDTPVSVRANH